MKSAPLRRVGSGSDTRDKEADGSDPQPVRTARTTIKSDPGVRHMAMVIHF